MRKLFYLFIIIGLASSCKKDDVQEPEPIINKEFYLTYNEKGEVKTVYEKNAYYGKVGHNNVLMFNSKYTPYNASLGYVIFSFSTFNDIKEGDYSSVLNSNYRCEAKVFQHMYDGFNFDKNFLFDDGGAEVIHIDSVYDYRDGFKVIIGSIDNVGKKSDYYYVHDIRFKLLVEYIPDLAKDQSQHRNQGYINAFIGKTLYKDNIYDIVKRTYNNKNIYTVTSSFQQSSSSYLYSSEYTEPGMAFTISGEDLGEFNSNDFFFNTIENCEIVQYRAVQDSFYLSIDGVKWLDDVSVKYTGKFHGVLKNGSKRLLVEDGKYEFIKNDNFK